MFIQMKGVIWNLTHYCSIRKGTDSKIALCLLDGESDDIYFKDDEQRDLYWDRIERKVAELQ